MQNYQEVYGMLLKINNKEERRLAMDMPSLLQGEKCDASMNSFLSTDKGIKGEDWCLDINKLRPFDLNILKLARDDLLEKTIKREDEPTKDSSAASGSLMSMKRDMITNESVMNEELKK